MILVVYSGSRFADWRIAEKGKIITGFKTKGINPYHNDEHYIVQLLHANTDLINYAERIKRIYFFGAGISSDERMEVVSKSLSSFFRYGKVYVYHDMQAAAIATCGDHEGLFGIVGSGSNAAYFTGKKVEVNNFGLGYVLADEGSANWLGRNLLGDLITERLPHDLMERFDAKYSLDRKQIMDKVYRQVNPVLFLSSFADFVFEHKDHSYFRHLIQEGFDLLFRNYFVPLKYKHSNLPVHFTGSVASDYQEILRGVAQRHGMKVGTVLREPIYNLLNYYINKNK